MVYMTQPMDVYYELTAPDQYDPYEAWCETHAAMHGPCPDPSVLEAVQQFPELTR